MDPEALEKWLPPSSMTAAIDGFDGAEGGGYTMTLTYVAEGEGKTTAFTDKVAVTFVTIDAPTMLRQDVTFDSDDEDFAGVMHMTWSVEPSAHGTYVTVTAVDVPVGISAVDHIAGFTASLDNLAAYMGDNSSAD